MSRLHLHILGSGSKGNCALVEGPQGLIMIDNGLSRRETLKRMAEIGFATDTGELTKQAIDTLEDCRVLALESNHDVAMLRQGDYPRCLQERILSAKGHLSNDQAANAARGLVTDRTEQLIAMHISQDNNRPSLTVKSYTNALDANLDDELGSSATLLQGSRKLSIRPASQYQPTTIQ